MRILWLLLALSLGCHGVVEDPDNRRPGFDPRPDRPRPDAPNACAEVAPRPTGMRVLRKRELRRVLTRTFGETLAAEAEVHFALLGDDALVDSIRGYDRFASENHALFIAQVAQTLGESIDDDPTRADACLASADDECLNAVFDRWSFPILHRALEDDERDELLTVARDESLGAVAAYLLLRPESLFLFELGGEEEEEGIVATLAHERAARLSFSLIGEPPSREFLVAVEAAGEDQDALATATRELLTTDTFQRRLSELLTYYIGPRSFPTVNAPDALLDGLESDGLGDEMRNELLLFLQDVTNHEGNQFERLMTSPLAFPPTDRVASLYGLDSAAPEGIAVEERPGVMLRAAVLSEGQDNTSPILRGLFVMRRMLCVELEPPDPELIQARLAEVETDTLTQSTRERIEIVTGSPQCAACHDAINPFGYALERFDPVGRSREFEQVFNDEGEVIATHAIDAETTLGDGTHVMNALELANAVVNDPRAAECLAQRAVELVQLSEYEREDACSLRRATNALRVEGAPLGDALLQATLATTTRALTLPTTETEEER